MNMMPLSLNAAILLFSIVGGYFYGRGLSITIGSNLSLSPRDISKLKLLLLSLSTLLITLPLAHLADWLPSLYLLTPMIYRIYADIIIFGLTLMATTFVCIAVSTLAIFTNHRYRRSLPLLMATVITVIDFTYYQRMEPIASILGDDKTEMGVILQTSGASCSAATCANIAAFYGLNVSEKEMAELLGTTRRGTERSQVLYGMKQLGFSSNEIFQTEIDLTRIRPPAYLNVGHPVTGPESHAVAYMGRADGKFEIWDPLSGKVYMSPKQIYQIWLGKAMEFSQ